MNSIRETRTQFLEVLNDGDVNQESSAEAQVACGSAGLILETRARFLEVLNNDSHESSMKSPKKKKRRITKPNSPKAGDKHTLAFNIELVLAYRDQQGSTRARHEAAISTNEKYKEVGRSTLIGWAADLSAYSSEQLKQMLAQEGKKKYLDFRKDLKKDKS